MLYWQADRGCFTGGKTRDQKGKKKKNEAKERHKRDCSENRETILVKKMSALLKSDTFNILYNTSKICLFFKISLLSMILRQNNDYRVHEMKYQYINVTKCLGTQCIGKTPQGTQFT